jgi:hypothetical protein
LQGIVSGAKSDDAAANDPNVSVFFHDCVCARNMALYYTND